MLAIVNPHGLHYDLSRRCEVLNYDAPNEPAIDTYWSAVWTQKGLTAGILVNIGGCQYLAALC